MLLRVVLSGLWNMLLAGAVVMALAVVTAAVSEWDFELSIRAAVLDSQPLLVAVPFGLASGADVTGQV